MASERERLLALLESKKISQAEYKELSAAFKQKGFWLKTIFIFLINPFQKIAGWNALMIGSAIMLMMSYFGSVGKIYFYGPLSMIYAAGVKGKIGPGFFLLLYQNISILLLLSGLFIIAAKVFQQKHIRIIDFLGTVALARFPHLALVICLIVMQFFNPDAANYEAGKDFELHLSFIEIISYVLFLFCTIWQIMTYFYAFKESSGLKDKKLWIGFIICIILAETLSVYITMAPVSKG